MDAHLEQQVRERAFQLWETGAMQGATDLDYWVAAESEVKAKLNGAPATAKRARTTKLAEKSPAKPATRSSKAKAKN